MNQTLGLIGSGNIGSALARQGNNAEAVKVLRRAVEVARTSGGHHQHRRSQPVPDLDRLDRPPLPGTAEQNRARRRRRRQRTRRHKRHDRSDHPHASGHGAGSGVTLHCRDGRGMVIVFAPRDRLVRRGP